MSICSTKTLAAEPQNVISKILKSSGGERNVVFQVSCCIFKSPFCCAFLSSLSIYRVCVHRFHNKIPRMQGPTKWVHFILAFWEFCYRMHISTSDRQGTKSTAEKRLEQHAAWKTPGDPRGDPFEEGDFHAPFPADRPVAWESGRPAPGGASGNGTKSTRSQSLTLN